MQATQAGESVSRVRHPSLSTRWLRTMPVYPCYGALPASPLPSNFPLIPYHSALRSLSWPVSSAAPRRPCLHTQSSGRPTSRPCPALTIGSAAHQTVLWRSSSLGLHWLWFARRIRSRALMRRRLGRTVSVGVIYIGILEARGCILPWHERLPLRVESLMIDWTPSCTIIEGLDRF